MTRRKVGARSLNAVPADRIESPCRRPRTFRLYDRGPHRYTRDYNEWYFEGSLALPHRSATVCTLKCLVTACRPCENEQSRVLSYGLIKVSAAGVISD